MEWLFEDGRLALDPFFWILKTLAKRIGDKDGSDTLLPNSRHATLE